METLTVQQTAGLMAALMGQLMGSLTVLQTAQRSVELSGRRLA
jgi:hypothetical protein